MLHMAGCFDIDTVFELRGGKLAVRRFCYTCENPENFIEEIEQRHKLLSIVLDK